MKLSKEHLDTILMALTRVEVLEERLVRKRTGEGSSQFLEQVVAAKAAINELKKEA